MDYLEKVCMQSYTAPQNLDLVHCLPHNYLYDIPIQSREVAKQISISGGKPVFPSMKLSSNMTLPVFEPDALNICDLQKDPLRGILEEKEEYLNQLRAFVKVAKEKQAHDPEFMRNVNTSSNRESFLTNRYMINIAECIARDPHPYMSETYVWLPVGGSIRHLSVGNEVFIITPDGNKFDRIRAIPVKENCGWQQDGPISRVDCPAGERILQIVTSRHKKRGFVGVRRLRGFNVIRFKPSDDNGYLKSRELIGVSDPAEALTALDISSLNGELACTLDISNSVKIYDIAAGKCVLNHKIVDKGAKKDPQRGYDGAAKFIQFSKVPSLVYIINKRKLFLKDMREPFKYSGTAFNVYDLSNGCEALSVSAESAVSDVLYCSSAHHTYSLDPRRGWLKRWNHGLDNMPLYLNVGVIEPLKEMVVTASMEMGSATGILNTWKETDTVPSPSFCSFPSALPSIMDTSFWANSNGLWLEPTIRKRIESSVCGMTLIPNQTSQGCSLFTLNAVGDVFSTSFRPDETGELNAFMAHNTPEANAGGIERIKEWQETHMKLISKGQVDLHCETLSDRSYLLTIMKQHLNKDAVARDRVHRWKRVIAKGGRAYRPRPRVDKDRPFKESRLRKMSTCKDWLACEILPFWDMDTLVEQARLHNPEGIPTVVLDSDDSS